MWISVILVGIIGTIYTSLVSDFIYLYVFFFIHLALCIPMDFPINIDTIIMNLPIVYLNRSQVEFLNLRCISVPEGSLNLSKQCRPR